MPKYRIAWAANYYGEDIVRADTPEAAAEAYERHILAKYHEPDFTEIEIVEEIKDGESE